MTFKKILQTIGATGHLPWFRTKKGEVGPLVTIKTNHTWRGVGISLNGRDKYDTWFHDSDETDQRRHYIRDLELITEDCKCDGKRIDADINNDCPRCMQCGGKVYL